MSSKVRKPILISAEDVEVSTNEIPGFEVASKRNTDGCSGYGVDRGT